MFNLFVFFCIIFFGNSQNLLPFLCPKNLSSDNLNCSIHSADFTISTKESKLSNISQFQIVNFNMDRNGGIFKTKNNFYNILNQFSKIDFLLSSADVLILTELARDCKIYGEYVDGPIEIAKKMNLSFGYVVEYVENYKEGDVHQCTIGNGIFSKYPLRNFEQIRLFYQCCKYDGRSGGRIALISDLPVNGKILTIYSTHLESGQNNIFSTFHSVFIRVQQINEIIKHTNKQKINSDYILIGGDLNAPLGMFDVVSLPLILDSFKDSHFSLNFLDRTTCPLKYMSRYGLFIFDYIWAKGDLNFENSIICNEFYDIRCVKISDHYPISTQVHFQKK